MARDVLPRRGPRGAARVLAAALLLAATCGVARAQSDGDADAGLKLAQTWCSSCHVVAPTKAAVSNGAPTFAGVARMKSATRMSLIVFLQTPHFPMPNFQLGNDQISNVVAYILSLRDK